MRAATFVAVLLLFGARAAAFGQSYDGPSQSAALAGLEQAWSRLAAGKPHVAYRAFSRELAYWTGFTQQSFGYVDAARGMMVAAIFARDDAGAQRAWKAIHPEGTEPVADKLVFAGRWNDAFRAYRDATQDQSTDPHPAAPDRVVAAGVDRALRADYRGAIAAWSGPAAGAGPYDLTDEQYALIGVAYARMRDWPAAEVAWLRASRIRRNVPQIDEFSDANITALAMLYHFRAHFATGEGRYHWRSVPQP